MFLRSAARFLEPSTTAIWSFQIIPRRTLIVRAEKLKNKGKGFPDDQKKPSHIHDFLSSNHSKGKRKESNRTTISIDTKTRGYKFTSTIDERKFRKIIVERHGQRIKLLTPVVLSARVTHLCQQGKLSDAIELVKSSPKDAQNAVVWANLIGFVIKSKKYKESYRLFTEMKRRGIKPTSRTYSTLLKGYKEIEDWSNLHLQMQNVYSIYDQVQGYFENIKRKPDQVPEEFNNIPYNLLIEIFGKAQEYRKMFDVYNSMDSTGPLAPNIYTYTTFLNAIAKRRTLKPSPQDVDAEDGSPLEVAYKNAADAKLIWQQILKLPDGPDSHSIRSVLVPLSRGRPTDQTLALDIVHEYLGFSRPGEARVPPKVQLHPQMLALAMSISNKTAQYQATIHYLEQAMDSENQKLLQREHMELAIESHAALASSDPGEAGQALEILEWMLRESTLPQSHVEESGLGNQVKPALKTFDLVGLACFHGGDWKSICRTFEVLTGQDLDSFQGDIRGKPRLIVRDTQVWPSGRFMACFLRTASKTGDPQNVRLALNVYQFYEFILGPILDPEKHGDSTGDVSAERRLTNAESLANALISVIPHILESEKDKANKSRWSSWLERASKFKASTSKRAAVDRPII